MTLKLPTSGSRSAARTKAYCFSEMQAAYMPMWSATSAPPTGGSGSEPCYYGSSTASWPLSRTKLGSTWTTSCSLFCIAAPQQLAFVVAYLSLIGAPISWKKASFGPNIIWCGWQFCFRTETVCLAQPKLDKLRAQLLQLLQHKRVPRKELEACLGLLMWATSISPHLHSPDLLRSA